MIVNVATHFSDLSLVQYVFPRNDLEDLEL
jgi:hypothetical protein